MKRFLKGLLKAALYTAIAVTVFSVGVTALWALAGPALSGPIALGLMGAGAGFGIHVIREKRHRRSARYNPNMSSDDFMRESAQALQDADIRRDLMARGVLPHPGQQEYHEDQARERRTAHNASAFSRFVAEKQRAWAEKQARARARNAAYPHPYANLGPSGTLSPQWNGSAADTRSADRDHRDFGGYTQTQWQMMTGQLNETVNDAAFRPHNGGSKPSGGNDPGGNIGTYGTPDPF